MEKLSKGMGEHKDLAVEIEAHSSSKKESLKTRYFNYRR